MVVLASNSITLANLPNMIYHTEVSVILLQPMYFSLVYVWKPENTDGPFAKYHVTGTDEYAK